MKRAVLAASCALLLLGGCRAMGPDYVRPAVPVPASYRDAPGSGAVATGTSLANLPWWQVFQDPALQQILRDGLAGNEDLRAAIARVDEARARARVAGADRYPSIEADGLASRDRASRDLSPEGSRTSNTFRGTVAASWEIDLWGRVRRSTEAAIADWVATEEGRRATVVTLVADLAEAYFVLRGLDEELEIARDTRDARQKTLDLFTQRLGSGVSSQLETSQAEADLAFAAATIPELERLVAQQENRISFLVGRAPGPVPRGPSLGATAMPPTLPTGLPARLLEQRPDVRAAEAEVVAANARVGVATAEMFPRLDLFALMGLSTRDLTELSTGRSSFGSIGGTLFAPIFEGGRLAGERDAACAVRDEAVARFRRSVEDALRDVADQLAAVKSSKESRVHQQRQVDALARALAFSSDRFSTGLAAYFEVLDAQRLIFPARIILTRTKRDQYVALVNLYRALGGGWAGGCPPPASVAPVGAAPGPAPAAPPVTAKPAGAAGP